MSASAPRSTLAALALACAALTAAFSAHAIDAQRGRALYELRCGECHSESVHGRTHRVARNIAEVRAWVKRWNDNLHLDWGPDEIDDVAAYLDTTYYHFCDTPACRAISAAPAAPSR